MRHLVQQKLGEHDQTHRKHDHDGKREGKDDGHHVLLERFARFHIMVRLVEERNHGIDCIDGEIDGRNENHRKQSSMLMLDDVGNGGTGQFEGVIRQQILYQLKQLVLKTAYRNISDKGK